jgi:cell wall-associated NlpC family hydrolase
MEVSMTEQRHTRLSPKSASQITLALLAVAVISVTFTISEASDSHVVRRPSATSTAGVTPAPTAVVINPDGTAVPPRTAPETVVRMIRAANRLVGLPYLYGGGHRSYLDSGDRPDGKLDAGYDGSGATSFVLHAAGLLPEPVTSEQLGEFGLPGPGLWITILACADGAHMIIAGVAFDAHGPMTSDAHAGPHWRPVTASEDAGCIVRHPDRY